MLDELKMQSEMYRLNKPDGSHWHSLSPEGVATPEDVQQAIALVESASLTFEAGWSDYGGVWTARAKKLSSGIVQVEGLVRRVAGAGNTICHLPSLFNVSRNYMFPALLYQSGMYKICRVSIYTNGRITLTNPQIAIPSPVDSAGIGWLSLQFAFSLD